MKKILATVLLVIMVISMTACGGSEGSSSDGEDFLQAFNKEATIDETLLVDQNGIKITATELTYDDYSAILHLRVENSNSQMMEVSCGTLGYSCNSINGYMVEEGYMNTEVEAGETAEERVEFSYRMLQIMGIDCIADMEIGFTINDSDYNSEYTEPAQIKTSIADSYKYDKESYRKVIDSNTLKNAYNYTVEYMAEDELYNKGDVKMVSEVVMVNETGSPVLMLEVQNNSAERYYLNTENYYYNGISVYDSPWSSNTVNPGKTAVIGIVLDDVISLADGDAAEITSINEIKLTFSVCRNYYTTLDSQEIIIKLPDIALPAEEE